jgi:hypothetical protein
LASNTLAYFTKGGTKIKKYQMGIKQNTLAYFIKVATMIKNIESASNTLAYFAKVGT